MPCSEVLLPNSWQGITIATEKVGQGQTESFAFEKGGVVTSTMVNHWERWNRNTQKALPLHMMGQRLAKGLLLGKMGHGKKRELLLREVRQRQIKRLTTVKGWTWTNRTWTTTVRLPQNFFRRNAVAKHTEKFGWTMHKNIWRRWSTHHILYRENLLLPKLVTSCPAKLIVCKGRATGPSMPSLPVSLWSYLLGYRELHVALSILVEVQGPCQGI